MISLSSLGGGTSSPLVNQFFKSLIDLVAGITPMTNNSATGVNSINFPSVNSNPDAFLFNGASNTPPISAVDHIDVVFPTDVVTNGFTLEFWFNCTKGTTSFIATQCNPAGGDPSSCWRIERNNSGSGTIEFGINDNGAGFGSSEYTSTNFPDNQWHHCVCTFESGTARIFKNGLVDSTFSATTNPAHQPDNIVRIGARMNSTPYAYGGQIAEFRLWGKVLSNPKILEQYNNTRKNSYGGAHDIVLNLDGRNHSGGWFGGNTWKDMSGNGNNGTISGASWSNGYFQFDGSNDQISVADSSDFDIGTSDFTIEFWGYMDTLPSSGDEYGMVGQDGSGSDQGVAVRWKNDGGTYRVIFNVGGLGSMEPPFPVIGAQIWKYCAVGRRSGTAFVNVDGVDISTTSSFTGSINNSSNPFYIGRSQFSGRYLDGRIARVRFTRGHGLSTTDLLQKFNAEKSSFGL